MPEAAAARRFDGARVVLVAAALFATSNPLLGAYGVIAPRIAAEFGTDASRIGVGMALAVLSMALSAPLLGRVFDRGPLRAVMLAGVALMVAAMVGLSQGVALWQLALGMSVLTIGLNMYGALPAQVILVNWFVAGRGMALGRAAVGGSVGALVVPPATAALVDAFGWRPALVCLALGAAAIAAPLVALFVVRRPEDVGQTPDGEVHPRASAAAAGQPAPAAPELLPLAALLRDGNFWWVGLGAGLALCASVATVFLVTHVERHGVAPTHAALVLSAMAGFGIVGKLAAGRAIDRLEARRVVFAALALHALGWTLLALGTRAPHFFVAAAALGLGGGGFLPLPAVLQGRCFGRDAIGRVSGLHALLGLPFLLASAPLVGWAEVRAGSFTPAFLAVAGVLGLAALAFVPVRAPHARPS